MRQDDEEAPPPRSIASDTADEYANINPRSRELLQLLMRSQDIGDAGSDSSSGSACGNGSSGGDSNDAPVAADAEVDGGAVRKAAPPSSALPCEVREFCWQHGIDAEALPAPESPAADPGVTFDGILSGDVSPVGIVELQLVSQTTEVAPEQEHRTLSVRNLALCGRIKVHAEPADFGGKLAARLHVQDVAGEAVKILVVDPAVASLPAQEFVVQAMRRFPAGTAIAITGFDLVVLPQSFMVILDLSEDTAAIRRLGAEELPPLKLMQVAHQCKLLAKAESHGVMVKVSVDGARRTEAEVAATLHPLLTRLAVAHLRLGADGVALAYATAALMLVFQRGPAAAATVAAQVLNKMGLKNGACAALYLGQFPEGHPLEPLESVGHEGLKAAAEIDGSRNVTTDERLSAAIRAGMTEYAKGLSRTEKEWLEHGLGPVPEVEAAADRAAAAFGMAATEKLKLEGDQAFTAGCPGAGVKNQHKVEDAVRKWRAALWCVLDTEGSPSQAGFSAWSLINCRYNYWHEASGQIEPPALAYMDLATLSVMRGEHINARALRANVYKGRCKLGDWQAVLDDALAASLASLHLGTSA